MVGITSGGNEIIGRGAGITGDGAGDDITVDGVGAGGEISGGGAGGKILVGGDKLSKNHYKSRFIGKFTLIF